MTDRAPDDETPRQTWPRILIIDDDPSVRTLATALMREAFSDAVIREAFNRSTFDEALRDEPADLAVTDYRLGWTDGLTVLRRLKARWPHCPVIMFTESGSEELAVEIMKAGADDYVLKSPKHIRSLGPAIRLAFDRADERHKAREAEARYRTMVDDVLARTEAGIFVLDAACRVVWMNETLERYFGIRRDEVLGQDKRRLIRKRIKHLFEDPDRFAATILEAYESGLEVAFECHLLPGDGHKERWLEHRSRLIRCGLYAGGRVEHYYDITERKRMEEALRLSAQQFQKVFEEASIGMALVAPDGRWLKVNRALCELTGYSSDELLAKTFQDITHPDDLEIDLAYVSQMLAGERRTYQMEKRYYHKQGHVVWILLSVSLVRDVHDQPLHFIAQIQNITERKEAEWRLLESMDRLETIVRVSPLPMLTLDRSARVSSWNPAAEQLFGWTEQELLGKPYPLVPESGRHEFQTLFEKVLRGELLLGMEVTRVKKNGTPVTTRLWTTTLSDRTGSVTGVLAMMEDATERKQMERHAGRIERLAALGQLLGGIAHELKNPLFVLTGRLTLLREKLTQRDYASLPSDLEKIEAAARRMTKITERFLSLARPAQPQWKRCEVATGLRETLEFLANECMKNQIQVVTHIAPDLPPIFCDPHQLQEVFMNLLLNAIYAMAKAHGRGTLTVSATVVGGGEGGGRTGDRIEIRIQDDGPGIAPGHREKLFEPFFSTKSPEEGTGLGLWTVRTIMMSLGGHIRYEPAEPTGAAFVIRLPVPQEGSAS